jgi:CHAT domain/SIR2-like domain
MARTNYRDIDLEIRPDGAGYEVRASSNCGGDGREAFAANELKLDPEITISNESNEAVDRHLIPLTSSTAKDLSLIKTRAPSLKKATDFGQLLFRVVFKDTIRDVLKECLRKTNNEKPQLRIRLNLTKAPALANLPWEFLSLVPENTFLATSYHSIVRYLELGGSFDESLLQDPPLRILAVLSNPEGPPKLDVNGELQKLQEAIAHVDDGRRIVLDALHKPTRRALRKKIHDSRQANAPYHVFHFIGHGVFDNSTKEGKLLIETETGDSSPISAKELGGILANGSFQLAIINACDGARISAMDSYSGVGQTLLRTGAVSTVIAMQYVITDGAAKTFAQCFYEELLKGNDMDVAISLARMTISDAENEQERTDSIEWGTPVLYMRAKDSRLIDFPAQATKQELAFVPQTQPNTPLERHYQEVLKALLEGQVVPFLGLNVNLFDQHVTPRPPTYDELVDRLTTFSKYPYSAGGLLPGVSQYAQLPDKLELLYNELDPLFNDGGFTPTNLHKFWANVAREQMSSLTDIDPKRKRFLIVTTNYDALLEQEFARTVRNFHIFSYIAEGDDQERGKFVRKTYHKGFSGELVLVESKNKELRDELPVILKLPGTIEPFNAKIRFAITEDQYFDLLTNRELTSILPSQIMTKLRGSHHLFMGCTLSDWGLRGILYRIWEKSWPSYESWAIQQQFSEFERKYWEASRVKIIDVGLVEYINGLIERLPPVQKNMPAAKSPQTRGWQFD